MKARDAADVSTLLIWALGTAAGQPCPVVSDEDATAAARRLAARAHRRLPGGLLPAEITITSIPAQSRCQACGCAPLTQRTWQ